jgi:uncharacterized protein
MKDAPEPEDRQPLPIRVAVRRASTPWQRLRGLLGAPPLAAGAGLLLLRCRAVHTLGMRHRIDVAFVDRAGVVLSLSSALAPARIAFCRRAAATLELRAGEIARLGLRQGCRIEFTDEGETR